MKEEEKKELAEAVKLVNAEIDKLEKKFQEMAQPDRTDSPVMVEGETSTGHYCQIMVDPKIIARIYLHYEMAIYRVLDLDLPDGVFIDLAEELGIKEVGHIDL